MKALIIAAGMGRRLGERTKHLPKSLLPIGDTTIIENLISHFKSIGIKEIGLVLGHEPTNFKSFRGLNFFYNPYYESNNILHSMMCARSFFTEDMIVSYSDIWVEKTVVESLALCKGDFCVSVDEEWEEQYVGRDLHPVSQAENAFVTNSGSLTQIGKHLVPEDCPKDEICGEFLGLFKFSKQGIDKWTQEFTKLEQQLDLEEPFQKAPRWESAYVTDMFAHLVQNKQQVNCSIIKRNWFEIDTEQDYLQLIEYYKKHHG